MKRRLIRSGAFVRAARKIVKKHPHLAEDLRKALELLEDDALHPRLRSHRLHGRLAGSWAASAAHDFRIVFRFVTDGEAEAILLLTVGTHEEVY